jgi:hypothetical protein
VHTALEAHLGSRQVSRVIYGSIIGLALVLVLEAHPPGLTATIVSLIATAVAVGLAELYSEVLGTETRERHRVSREQVAEILEDVAAVAFGVAFPAVFFVAAALDLVSESSAFTLAKWSGLGLIGGYGFFAARLAGAGTARALLQGLFVSVIGAALIAVKALVH